MTQKERILKHLEQYGSITSLECVTEYGIIDGRKCISMLRAEGVPIRDRAGRGHNRYGEPVSFKVYTLER